MLERIWRKRNPLVLLVEMYVTDFRPFFFSSICIQCYKFPSKHCFSFILLHWYAIFWFRRISNYFLIYIVICSLVHGLFKSILLHLKHLEREQDGRGVGGCGAHLSPWIHQEYTFRHRSACRTPAESGQEYLTSRKEYIDSRKTW